MGQLHFFWPVFVKIFKEMAPLEFVTALGIESPYRGRLGPATAVPMTPRTVIKFTGLASMAN